MINFVASDIEEMFAMLKSNGVEVDGRGVQVTQGGKFVWFTGIEDNRIEMWKPSDLHG